MSSNEILDEIKALSSHYPRRQLSAADQLRWFEDYASDLKGYTGSDIRLGCAIWRQRENRRMPSPGELMAICGAMTRSRSPERRYIPPPEEPQVDPVQRAAVGRLFEELAASFKTRDYRRLKGENEVEYGRRLWPNREVAPR